MKPSIFFINLLLQDFLINQTPLFVFYDNPMKEVVDFFNIGMFIILILYYSMTLTVDTKEQHLY